MAKPYSMESWDDLNYQLLDAKARIQQLERENAGLRNAAAWQPMDTAPKDGKRFLAGWNTTVRKSMSPQWITVLLRWKDNERDNGGNFVSCPGDWQYEATNWMPLPPAPNQEAVESIEQMTKSHPRGCLCGVCRLYRNYPQPSQDS